ncbi:hypothetical protein N7448_009680 [Penicillium atrosanguineum]|nr:hypothetical protein N7448_009680 [Penicillium atrosanguineum]
MIRRRGAGIECPGDLGAVGYEDVGSAIRQFNNANPDVGVRAGMVEEVPELLNPDAISGRIIFEGRRVHQDGLGIPLARNRELLARLRKILFLIKRLVGIARHLLASGLIPLVVDAAIKAALRNKAL